MYCPYCKSKNTKVIDKRDNQDTQSTRRRRECEDCGKRFTTYERVEKVLLNVIKRNGKLEEFDREKLKRSIMKGLNKRHISESKINSLLDEIESKLMMREESNIRSVDVGELVLAGLTRIDKLGALLFASVYKEFESLEEVQKELKRLSKD